MPINASVRDKLQREITRTKNHLAALEDLYEEILEEAPRRKSTHPQKSWVPLMEKCLAKVRGERVFSVKELTAMAQRIDPETDRRLIYNCIKGYLQTGVKHNEYEQVSDTEYKRT